MPSSFLTNNSSGQSIFLSNGTSSQSSQNPTMEQIRDVSILNPLESGQVLVFNGDVWQNIVPQSLVNDTLGSLLDVGISSLNNVQVLTYNSISTKWINSNISESQITNLTTYLSNCEKNANKGISNGYCGLDTNSLISVSNIPNLPESQINNLSNGLSNKADLVS